MIWLICKSGLNHSLSDQSSTVKLVMAGLNQYWLDSVPSRNTPDPLFGLKLSEQGNSSSSPHSSHTEVALRAEATYITVSCLLLW